MKNKTIAAWLTFFGGPLGLHRFYLYGMGDLLGWMLPIPTALGLYGIERVQQMGLDDHWALYKWIANGRMPAVMIPMSVLLISMRFARNYPMPAICMDRKMSMPTASMIKFSRITMKTSRNMALLIGTSGA